MHTQSTTDGEARQEGESVTTPKPLVMHVDIHCDTNPDVGFDIHRECRDHSTVYHVLHICEGTYARETIFLDTDQVNRLANLLGEYADEMNEAASVTDADMAARVADPEEAVRA